MLSSMIINKALEIDIIHLYISPMICFPICLPSVVDGRRNVYNLWLLLLKS